MVTCVCIIDAACAKYTLILVFDIVAAAVVLRGWAISPALVVNAEMEGSAVFQ